MDLGQALKQLRKALKVTRRELASRSGLSVTALYNIENGSSFPTQKTIDKLCKALGLPVSYLMVFSLSDSDISPERRGAYRCYMIPLRLLLLEELGFEFIKTE